MGEAMLIRPLEQLVGFFFFFLQSTSVDIDDEYLFGNPGLTNIVASRKRICEVK